MHTLRRLRVPRHAELFLPFFDAVADERDDVGNDKRRNIRAADDIRIFWRRGFQ